MVTYDIWLGLLTSNKYREIDSKQWGLEKGYHFENDIFKYIFMKGNVFILILIPLKFCS